MTCSFGVQQNNVLISSVRWFIVCRRQSVWWIVIRFNAFMTLLIMELNMESPLGRLCVASSVAFAFHLFHFNIQWWSMSHIHDSSWTCHNDHYNNILPILFQPTHFASTISLNHASPIPPHNIPKIPKSVHLIALWDGHVIACLWSVLLPHIHTGMPCHLFIPISLHWFDCMTFIVLIPISPIDFHSASFDRWIGIDSMKEWILLTIIHLFYEMNCHGSHSFY